MKTWLKAFFITSGVLLVFMFALPTLLKSTINQLASDILTGFDIQADHLIIDHLSWSRLSINQIQLEIPAQNTKVSLKNLNWHYSPLGLFNVELGRLNIETLNIVQTAKNLPSSSARLQTASSNNKDQDQQLITIPTVEEAFAKLPFEQVRINQLNITVPQATLSGDIFYDSSIAQIHQNIQTPFLNEPINFEFKLTHTGELFSQIVTENSSAPIFIWQGRINETEQADGQSIISINAQQIADIQSWLALASSQKLALKAESAIQTLNIQTTLPKQLSLGQTNEELLTQIDFNNSLQLEVSKLSAAPTLKRADISLEILNTLMDKEWLVFDINKLKQLARMQLTLANTDGSPASQAFKQTFALEHPLQLRCSIKTFNCFWKGDLTANLMSSPFNKSNGLSASAKLALNGELPLWPLLDNNSEHTLEAQHSLSLSLKQGLSFFPKLETKLTTQLHLTAAQDQTWQLSLPHGLKGNVDYQEQTIGKLSPIQFTLFNQFHMTGQASQVNTSNDLAFQLNKIQWQDLNNPSKKMAIKDATGHCHMDWYQLQNKLKNKLAQNSETLKQLPLQCQLLINTEEGQWDKWPVPALALNTKLDVELPKIRSEILLTGLNNKLDLKLNTQHHMEDNKGAAQLYLKDLPLDWNAIGLERMQLLTKAQFLNGLMSAQGWVHWEQYQPDFFDDSIKKWRWQPDIMLRVDDFAGIYNSTTTWEGMDFLMAVRRPLFKDFQIDAQVSADNAHTGIEVTNILARTSTSIPEDFSKAVANIKEVHADVLGGSIKIPLLTFDTSKQHNEFTIIAEHIDLQQVAKLEPQAGVKAKGLLDGRIPVKLGPKVINNIITWTEEDEDLWGEAPSHKVPSNQDLWGDTSTNKLEGKAEKDIAAAEAFALNIHPVIEKGTLYARSPGGVVEYKGQTSDSLKGSNPMVKLAMQALENYHYDTLQTDINYQPDGALKLDLQFKGKNPDFFDGQATHFNLSLNYNLLDLLESLRISQDIVERVENRYQ